EVAAPGDLPQPREPRRRRAQISPPPPRPRDDQRRAASDRPQRQRRADRERHRMAAHLEPHVERLTPPAIQLAQQPCEPPVRRIDVGAQAIALAGARAVGRLPVAVTVRRRFPHAWRSLVQWRSPFSTWRVFSSGARTRYFQPTAAITALPSSTAPLTM